MKLHIKSSVNLWWLTMLLSCVGAVSEHYSAPRWAACGYILYEGGDENCDGMARSARAEASLPLACIDGAATAALERGASLTEPEAVLQWPEPVRPPPEPEPAPPPLAEMLAGLETPPPAVLAQSIRLAGSAHRFQTAAVGQVSLVQVVDPSVPVGVAAQAAALAEEVRQAQWLLGEHPWDMSIVIDDGWEAPPIPEPVAETGDEAAEGEGAAEEEAAPEPAPPAVRPPGPGAELAAAVTELLGSGSQASVRCTSAWVAPEPPEGEEGEERVLFEGVCSQRGDADPTTLYWIMCP